MPNGELRLDRCLKLNGAGGGDLDRVLPKGYVIDAPTAAAFGGAESIARSTVGRRQRDKESSYAVQAIR